ncbi:MAG: ATP-binding protein [Caldilineales bacterium]|nr:ATP-binding protein [Caldilineales bacterium]
MPPFPRFSPDYRGDELALIADHARRGLSCAFIGIAGIGKSNLLNCLAQRYRTITAPDGTPITLQTVIVDCNDWNEEPADFWRLLRRELEKTLSPTNVIPLSGDPAERDNLIIRHLAGAFCSQPGHRLVVVFDDADRLLMRGPLELLEQLRTLRDENRDVLSFLLFTKKLPLRLGRACYLTHESKFYQLFSSHLFTLRPYNQADAWHMLRFLNTQAAQPLPNATLRTIYHLTDGHATLLKLVHERYLIQPPSTQNPVGDLLAHPPIRQACERIFHSLHRHEQQVLLRMTHDRSSLTADLPALILLRRRGLLLEPDDRIFSVLFENYLKLITSY